MPSTLYLSSASSNCDKATLFNKFFHSVFNTSSFEIPPLQNVSPNLSEISICDADVYRQLSSLNTTKSKGLDGIGPAILKHCAVALTEPLTHLFQQSLNHHILPGEWKLHAITPIYKSGDRNVVSNYRPITLLSCTSKVQESLI